LLALIAGSGALPGELVSRLEDAPLICTLDGNDPDTLKVDVRFRLETLGTLLENLREKGVTRICMAGAIGRPVIDPGAIDAATRPLVPLLQAAMASGDDGALRAAITAFEQGGFKVSGAHEIAPDLLPPAGCATLAQPDVDDRADAVRGARIVAAMSAVDIGQACAVFRAQALAVEGKFGTDWMLGTLKNRPDKGGGLLFKAPKPGQDRRVDLPAIGADTITAAAAAGLSGVVIEAGGVLVLNPAGVEAHCNHLGLFLWVREPS